jgi:hypothetical protein
MLVKVSRPPLIGVEVCMPSRTLARVEVIEPSGERDLRHLLFAAVPPAISESCA